MVDQTKTLDKVKITVDGQEIEVTQDELKSLAQQGKDYTKKMQLLSEKEKTIQDKERTIQEQEKQVSSLKTIIDEMETNPKLKENLNKVYSDFKSGKIAKSAETGERNLKLIDKLIEGTDDPAQKESLRDTRVIIEQETKRYGEENLQLRQEVEEMKKKLASIESAATVGLNDRIKSQMKELEADFGKELVEKYHKDITSTAYKYPNQSVKKILYHYADDSEIEKALLDKAKRNQEKELNRKKDGSDAGGENFVATTPVSKDKFGRVTHDSLIQRAKERMGWK